MRIGSWNERIRPLRVVGPICLHGAGRCLRQDEVGEGRGIVASVHGVVHQGVKP